MPETHTPTKGLKIVQLGQKLGQCKVWFVKKMNLARGRIDHWGQSSAGLSCLFKRPGVAGDFL